MAGFGKFCPKTGAWIFAPVALFSFFLEKFLLTRLKKIVGYAQSFENFRPKTQAWNLAPAGSILFQFQKFKNLVNDPQFFEPWE